MLLAGGGDVSMSIIESGHRESVVKVDELCSGRFQGKDCCVSSDGEDGAVFDGECGDTGGGGAAVGVLAVSVLEMRSGQDVAMKVDGVGGLGNQRNGEDER